MLIDQKVPHAFWAEALATSVYLKNRSPTSFLDRQTPFEAWKGKKPDVSHLRVFGCDAYVHVSKDERRKLDPKVKKFMFLGYGEETKGYRLYDSERNKVIFSRDLYFHETRRDNLLEPFEKQHSKTEKIVLQNDMTSEDSEDNDEEFEMSMPPEIQELAVRRSQRIRRQPNMYVAGNVTIANKNLRNHHSMKRLLAVQIVIIGKRLWSKK